MNTENQRDARTQSDASAQQEGGYGTPAPEEEVPQPASSGQKSGHPAAPPTAPAAAPEEAPSTDAEIDQDNASDAEDDGHRESFSSESDAEASGLPDAGSSD